MKSILLFVASSLLCGVAQPVLAQTAPQQARVASAAPVTDWQVRPEWIRAHERFLAGPELRGRGSATHDEAVAAAYVASEFLGYGLHHAPGMDSYIQQATIVRTTLSGEPQLAVAGAAIPHAQLLMSDGRPVAGKLAVFSGSDPSKMPQAAVVATDAKGVSPIDLWRQAKGRGVRLLILRESDMTTMIWNRLGKAPRMPTYLAGQEPEPGVSLVVLPAAQYDALAKQAGSDVAFALPGLQHEKVITTNAIGYLPGSDPKAGVILFSAHLDHLGMRPDGTMMPGANDDASGTTAVLELAHALAAGKEHRRGILFVAYGSEEIGGYGSTYFGEHPPVPLSDIVANIEIEMIGAQDPKLPDGTMMMTGFERSNLGPALAAHGALVTKDPYPQEHFFQRSDNYSLALKGVVAHTISGWAVTPTYHSPTDTIENLNVGFMVKAIQSLIGPARWLADSDFKPEWVPGGKPEK